MAENAINQAIKQICEEKNISFESVIDTIEAALAVAYRKDFGDKNENIQAKFDPEKTAARVFDVKEVVDDEMYEKTLKWKEEKEKEAAEESAFAEASADKKKKVNKKKDKKESSKDEKKEGNKEEEEDFEKFDPKKHITLTEAKKIKKEAKIGEEIRTELFPPAAYGRMAAQTAKQVIIQRLREAEREMLYKEFKGKEGEIISGIVQRQERRVVLIDLGQTTGIILPSEQIHEEEYRPGMRIKIFVVSVTQTTKGPEIIVSRAHPNMVKRLFTLEVPEISAGTVEIKSVSREAGSRTKIAVQSNQSNIDPVGSCVGQRGSRVQTIISELGGEKIDIVEFSDDPVEFITNALSPAKIINITLNEKERTASAEVREDQLSLAIGKAGQNVRLAAKLTGWKIDIVSEDKKITGESSKEEKDEKEKKEKEEDKKEEEKEESNSKKEKKEEIKETETKESTSVSDKSTADEEVTAVEEDTSSKEATSDKKASVKKDKKEDK